MNWKIEVSVKTDLPDPAGKALQTEVRDRGFDEVESIRVTEVYLVEGGFSPEEVQDMGRRLFADPVVHEFRVTSEQSTDTSAPESNSGNPDAEELRFLEVYRHPGVMDPYEMNIRRALDGLGYQPSSIRTGRQYRIRGTIRPERLLDLGKRILSNPAIEELEVGTRPPRPEPVPPPVCANRREVPLVELSDDGLMGVSRERRLALNLPEMSAIRDHFRDLGREPTDVEIEMIAQTWSEHCKHKTLGGRFEFQGETIENLLGETIMQATRDLDLPWCLSVFKDNAGVIAFTEEDAVCFKVETHNHPSAIEPYGGAGTGIGGVIRDILGTGLAAKPILNTDVFCFAPPETPDSELPPGTLAPRQVLRGVVSGVRDYGNRMGIPTASGGLFFDPRYVGNPLVYCGTVGILPRNRVEKRAAPGDNIVLVGGRTGRDGLGGATFSSAELTDESEVVSSGAVQIGNPIEEKRVLDVILEARDRDLFRCITDCGAGGLSSAVGEMGEGLGVELELSRVPLKYPGLSSAEIWLSEAQERMVLAVPPENLEAIQNLMESEDVEASVLGTFTDSGRIQITDREATVLDLDLSFLHDGLPRVTRTATWTPVITPLERPESGPPPGEVLKTILGNPTVASKEWVIRQYDHEVQGASVLKPLVGEEEDGPGDAAVIAPLLGRPVGLAVGCGMNPRTGDLDPYRMAATGIDEAIRNLVAVGADPERIALLDNFSWGSATDPESLGALILACRACRDLSLAFKTPFISGKDSLNNEYRVGGETISIPPTLLISAIGIVPEIHRVVSMDLKGVGHNLFLVGETRRELGGSYFLEAAGGTGGEVPKVEIETARKTFAAIYRAIRAGLVRACHDLSEGGLGVAVAESAFAGGVGAKIDLARVPVEPSEEAAKMSPEEILFSESNSRFLVEVLPDRTRELEEVLKGIPMAKVGETTSEPYLLVVHGDDRGAVLREPLAELKEAWQRTLRFDETTNTKSEDL